MRRNLFKIFLVVTISSVTLFVPSYPRWSNLIVAKLPSADLSIENPDQEEESPDQQKQMKGFISNVFSADLQPGARCFYQIPHLSFLTSPLDPETFVLRC